MCCESRSGWGRVFPYNHRSVSAAFTRGAAALLRVDARIVNNCIHAADCIYLIRNASDVAGAAQIATPYSQIAGGLRSGECVCSEGGLIVVFSMTCERGGDIKCVQAHGRLSERLPSVSDQAPLLRGPRLSFAKRHATSEAPAKSVEACRSALTLNFDERDEHAAERVSRGDHGNAMLQISKS